MDWSNNIEMIFCKLIYLELDFYAGKPYLSIIS